VEEDERLAGAFAEHGASISPARALASLWAMPSAQEPLYGRCLCKAVRFAVNAPFESAGYCHCKRCQRRSGTTETLNGIVAAAGFEVLHQELNQVAVACEDSLLAAVQAEGTCYPSTTVWRGRRGIRLSVCNWQTTFADVDRSVEALVAARG
jgi:hypothetical protein